MFLMCQSVMQVSFLAMTACFHDSRSCYAEELGICVINLGFFFFFWVKISWYSASTSWHAVNQSLCYSLFFGCLPCQKEGTRSQKSGSQSHKLVVLFHPSLLASFHISCKDLWPFLVSRSLTWVCCPDSFHTFCLLSDQAPAKASFQGEPLPIISPGLSR